MGKAAIRRALEQLEAAQVDRPAMYPALALAAGARIELPDGELNGARRRALLLLAAGGDPHAGLALDGRAVRALAEELDRPQRREALAAGLATLEGDARGLGGVDAALEELRGDPELAWRAFACALLAEELS